MAETVVLDPTEVATSRTAFDITPWIAEAGVDWGDAEIQTYMADQARGSTPVDYRVPNRTVQIPLLLRTRGGTAFVTARSLVQAKAALAQREGGWIKRITAAGGTVFADIVNATLKLPGSWSQAHKDYDLEAMLTLECLPDFYESERTLADHTLAGAAELLFTETDIDGDYPARVRAVVDEDAGQSQLGLIWSFRSKHYSSAATAAPRFQAEALNPLDTATKVALSGASAGTVVTHGTLSTNWTPVLGTDLGGTASLTHTGTNRLWVRYRTTSGTAVELRAVWDVGDLVMPVENVPVRSNAGTQFFLADLGELRLDRSPVGTHRWQGMIQARGLAGGENVSLDKVWVLNADEGYGVLRAPVDLGQGLAPYAARDEFNQSAGALTGKTLAAGGTWSGSGDGDDFSVEATGHTAQRVAVSDTAGGIHLGRLVRASTPNLAKCLVRVDCKVSALGSGLLAVLARYADTSNFLYAYAQPGLGTNSSVGLAIDKRVAGTSTNLASIVAPVNALGSYITLQMVVDENGKVFLWCAPQGAPLGSPLLMTNDDVLATGGALATGAVGFADYQPDATANTRTYNNFAAWVPSLDAVLHANQSAELRTDGMFREDSTGAGFGPVSYVVGDLPRLPPTVEGRTTEVLIKGSRGDLDQLPDTGIDDLSAQLFYRPCWLTVPGT